MRVSLWLEDLEGRAHPSGLGTPSLAPTEPTAGQESILLTGPDEHGPTNQAPLIDDLKAREVTNGVFLVTGRVLDERPGGLTVWFGGVPSAEGYYAVTDADGYFSLYITLRTDGTDSGNLIASVTDDGGLSDEDFVYVFPTPP
jgi:hypothetical protein